MNTETGSYLTEEEEQDEGGGRGGEERKYSELESLPSATPNCGEVRISFPIQKHPEVPFFLNSIHHLFFST